MKITVYEAKAGADVKDALRAMYFKVAHGGYAVMKFNDVTITMQGKTVDVRTEVIREVSALWYNRS